MQPPAPVGPDLSRDPFAAAPPTRPAHAEVITDAGPLVDVPMEKKSRLGLIALLLVTAAIPLVVGWSCGRIYHARVLFNKTIVDARGIKKEVIKLVKLNRRLVGVLAETRTRGDGKIIYDEQMVEDLKDILRASPLANPKKAKKSQEKLFRTNYAMMEDMTIYRLFDYYNNSLRLLSGIETFLQKTNRTKDLIKAYSANVAKKKARRYGLVISADMGKYYLGDMVELGNPICEDAAAEKCPNDKVKGFRIRAGLSGEWQDRPGKPSDPKKIEEVVIPINPQTDTWKQVAVGRRGFLPYREYVMGYAQLTSIASRLRRDEKTLIQDLGKQANRERLFDPFSSGGDELDGTAK